MEETTITWIPEVVAALVAMVVASITAYTQIKIKKLEKTQAEVKEATQHLIDKNQDLRIKEHAYKIMFDYRFYFSIKGYAIDLFEFTNIDRVIVFFATNGKKPVKYITEALEFRRHFDSDVHGMRYVRVELDEEYKKLLAEVELNSEVYIKTGNLQDSLLKGIYLSKFENIKYAIIKFLARYKLSDEDDLLVYMSFGTTKDLEITSDERIRIRLCGDTIKSKILEELYIYHLN